MQGGVVVLFQSDGGVMNLGAIGRVFQQLDGRSERYTNFFFCRPGTC